VAHIKIDHSVCTTPLTCKKCLHVCPQTVFFVGAAKFEKFKINDPAVAGMHKVVPMYRDKCTACMKCIEVCPLNAIDVQPTVHLEEAR
jgi:NAD-dependent dihydropyrimidine dehydrogenase PreA subunit